MEPSTKADVTERIKRRAQGRLDPTASAAQSAPSVEEAQRVVSDLARLEREGRADLAGARTHLDQAITTDAARLQTAQAHLDRAGLFKRGKARTQLDQVRTEMQARYPGTSPETLTNPTERATYVNQATHDQAQALRHTQTRLTNAKQALTQAQDLAQQAQLDRIRDTLHASRPPTTSHPTQPFIPTQSDAQTLTHQQRQTQQRRGRTR